MYHIAFKGMLTNHIHIELQEFALQFTSKRHSRRTRNQDQHIFILLKN